MLISCILSIPQQNVYKKLEMTLITTLQSKDPAQNTQIQQIMNHQQQNHPAVLQRRNQNR